MAITLNTPTLVTMQRAKRGARFAKNFTTADATGAEEVLAAPGAGKNIHVTKIILQSDDADAHPYLLTATTLFFGPLLSSVEGMSLEWEACDDTVIQLPANTALNLDAAAAGNVYGYVEGYVDQ